MKKITYVNKNYLCYFCYFCKTKVDNDGSLLLSLDGSVKCNSCKKSNSIKNLIVIHEPTLILTYSGPRQLSS